jgi:hypothetical protein
MANASKQVIIDDIVAQVELGKERGNVLATIGKKWQLSQRTFDRYWKEANKQHTERQGTIKAATMELDTTAALNAKEGHIASVLERKAFLTKIMRGEADIIETTHNEKLGITTFERKPNPTEQIKALSELNKMEGDYAPVKQAQTNVNGEDVNFRLLINDPLIIVDDKGNESTT